MNAISAETIFTGVVVCLMLIGVVAYILVRLRSRHNKPTEEEVEAEHHRNGQS